MANVNPEAADGRGTQLLAWIDARFPLSKMMREHAMEAVDIVGSGKREQILKADVINTINARDINVEPSIDIAPMPQHATPVAQTDAGREERVRMSKLRQTIARRLKEAQNTTAIAWAQLDNVTFLDTGFTKTLRARHAVGESKFNFPNITTLIAMLRSNLGVSVLPSLAVPKSINDLVSRSLVPSESRNIFLITRKGWTLSPAAEAMIDTITRETPQQAQRYGLTML